MYIDDCIEGILRLTSSDFHQPVNLGSDEMISINGLVDLLSEISHKKWKKKHVEGPQGVRGRNSDNTLIQQVLKWAPSISIREGITQTYAWISQEIQKGGVQMDQFCQSKIV